ncbi:hypothetical protein J4E90_007038 [Alternaria incomplexa]|uniref:uncharacterized protein n=1 Tax=Alternaria incomplexa TaxID=1187928 RepID=UPI002220A335|nr:uncharacterized protein J4E90_007038 [Alternaria incomplexa]KAI4910782.1 hypothetical protein J4E90_007038 [Alternaria incomplexa]
MTDNQQPSRTPWATATIVDLDASYYPTVLSWNGSPLNTITVVPSPSLFLQVTSSVNPGQLIATVIAGAPPITFDGLILSLQTSPEQAILFTVDGVQTQQGSTVTQVQTQTQQQTQQVSKTNPSTRSESSTFVRPTTAITPPRSTKTSRPNPTRNGRSKPGIGSGAIAGIAIAGIVILALIIGGWYFWRRKKRRAQPPAATLTEDELARREGDGDKMVLGADQSAPTAGAYQTQYQEISGNGLTQELDRLHPCKYEVGEAQELRAEDQPGELPYNGMEEHRRANETGAVGRDDGGDDRNAEMVPVTGANNSTSQVSPHVEAQRKREVEWLEMEETRMRQRREALLQQGGGQHT